MLSVQELSTVSRCWKRTMASRLVFLCLVFQVISGEVRTERELNDEACGDLIWNARCARFKNKGYCDNPETEDEMRASCAWTCGYCGEQETDKVPEYKAMEEAEIEKQKQEEEEMEQNTAESSQTNSPTCGRSTVASSRVIAGTDASLGEWPWQAWLHIKETGFTCGGSLIAPQWVLTAAHCILEPEPEKYHVILGDVNRNKTEGSEQKYKVVKIIAHENYEKPVEINNDVALLKLSRPARTNAFVNTVCLPNPHVMVPLKTRCYITGWGMMSYPGNPSTVLQQAPIPVAPSTLCQAGVLSASHVITPGMLCAGDKGETKNSGCFGDSGGPFVCRNPIGQWVLQGVVSWGEPTCNSTIHFSVFARVSMYRDWIEKTIQANQKQYENGLAKSLK